MTPFSPASAAPSDTATFTRKLEADFDPSRSPSESQGCNDTNCAFQKPEFNAYTPGSLLPRRNLRGTSRMSPVHLNCKLNRSLRRRPAVWHIIPKAGGWAIRSVRLGFSKVGSHLGFGRRHQDSSR